MDIQAKLDQIPRGNTCPGVNRMVIEYLLSSGQDFNGTDVLDVPCGEGGFLDVLTSFFPGSRAYGADLLLSLDQGDHRFIKADLSDEKPLETNATFSLITSISGVMEFDNTLNFFRKIRDRIAEDSGLFIVTNDNLLSARDRLLYLFTGRLRQYPIFVNDDAPTWKILPLQNLLRILQDSGFREIEIRYVSPKWTEWIWLPVALPIFLTQTFSFILNKNRPPYAEKAKRYPFASLLSRHYLVVCRPTKLG